MGKADRDERITDPTARALALLALLQTHRLWKGCELAHQLGVSERTVRRDVERLRGLGYPVDAGPGVDGGYQLAAGAHVPPLLLDDDEAVALIVGVRAAALATIDGIEDTTVRLMAKLDRILPDHVRRRVDALHGSVEVLAGWPRSESIPVSTLTVLGQACRDREEIRFDYRRRDGEESRRLVQPAQLVTAGRRWYLVAWDVRRDDWRTFRVDRIDNPTLAGARFELRPLPTADAATFVAEGLRAMSTEHHATVVVNSSLGEVEPAVRWLDATTEALGERRTRVQLRAESLEWVASMIAIIAVSFDIAAVEAPAEVRALITTSGARLRALPAPVPGEPAAPTGQAGVAGPVPRPSST
jgi:predicted DNA-binding transcriptional regulator YafY